jgi:hypothetical protein
MVVRPTGGGPTQITAAAPICAFGAAYVVLDATTGKGMLAAAG